MIDSKFRKLREERVQVALNVVRLLDSLDDHLNFNGKKVSSVACASKLEVLQVSGLERTKLLMEF
jgi:hypothetical protein